MMNQLFALCCISSFFVQSAIAQERKIFTDDYGVKGEVRYAGVITDSSLPEKGPLNIRWREVYDGKLRTYSVNGQTKDGKPTGRWIWEEAEWDYVINAGRTIQPSFNASGLKKKWVGQFKEGRTEGRWDFSLDSVNANAITVKMLATLSLNYKDGVPVGAVRLTDNQTDAKLKLNATVNKDGIATGKWNFQYNDVPSGVPVKEQRTYDDGLLTFINTLLPNYNLSDTIIEHVVFLQNPTSNASEKIIGETHFSTDGFEGVTSATMHWFNQHYLSGWRLDAFPFNVQLNLPAFKRLEYPLSQKEKADIEESRQLIKKQQKSIEEHLGGNIYIHRSRSATLDTTISALQLHQKQLSLLDSLIGRVAMPLFTYKNRRAQGTEHWVSTINENRTGKGEIHNRLTVELQPLSLRNEQQGNIFAEIKELLLNNNSRLADYFLIINDANVELRRAGELKSLEDSMVARLERLQQQFSEEEGGIGKEIKQKWIKGDIQNYLQVYANTNSYDSALQLGNTIMVYLDSLEIWKDKVPVFDSMQQLLKSQYAHMAYNPYTGANDIEVVTKRRFINNVLNVMWPYTLKEIEEADDWHKWSTLWTQQFEVYNFLLSFVTREDGAAKRLNNRVRKERSPEKMLRTILGSMED